MGLLRRPWRLAILVVALTALAAACGDDDATAESGATLAAVIERDVLRCGVNDVVPGFGFEEADGSFTGFDVDFCRAVAAAVLGDASKVEYVPLTAANRFDALADGDIDVLIRNTTWTAERDGALRGAFATPTFYDGQGMMVRADSGWTSIEEMDGASICVLEGTTTETQLADRFAASGLTYTPVVLGDASAIEDAFVLGDCEGWTADRSQLAARRSVFPMGGGGPEALTIFAETFSNEPLAPVTLDGDSEWAQVVDWVVLGMVAADQLNVTSANVAAMASDPPSAAIADLLGVPFDGAPAPEYGLGIDDTFLQVVLAQVGNYDEVYERNLTPLGIQRTGTLNALWSNGGLLYAPPMR